MKDNKTSWLVVFIDPDSRFPQVYGVEMTGAQAVAVEKALEAATDYSFVGALDDLGLCGLDAFLDETGIEI